MFNKKETALLGTTIYLFSPLIFSQSSLAMLASGVVFFLILISYYFLRFLKDENNRDLILTAYFIGLGSIYRNELMLMFIICFTYLLLRKIKNMDWSSTIQFKILLLSLIPIVPWMMISIDVYEPIWSNLITFNELITYSLMIQSQVSSIIFALFLLSGIFILFTKKDGLLLFFGYLFIAYYLFYTIMETAKYDHRYAAPLYPTIAVFIAWFIFSIAQRIRWKHAFKLFFSVLAIYLIVLCVIPRSSSSLTTFKYRHHEIQYFPIEKATDWIVNNTGKDEKVMALLHDYGFFVEKIYKNRHKLSQNKFVSTVINNEDYTSLGYIRALKKSCLEENITYVMFSYGPNNIYTPNKRFQDFLEHMRYLHENIGKEFIKAAEFNIDDNYIFIYKLKENSFN
jgi:hypothetical protein